jgi:hypothetical protein
MSDSIETLYWSQRPDLMHQTRSPELLVPTYEGLNLGFALDQRMQAGTVFVKKTRKEHRKRKMRRRGHPNAVERSASVSPWRPPKAKLAAKLTVAYLSVLAEVEAVARYDLRACCAPRAPRFKQRNLHQQLMAWRHKIVRIGLRVACNGRVNGGRCCAAAPHLPMQGCLLARGAGAVWTEDQRSTVTASSLLASRLDPVTR